MIKSDVRKSRFSAHCAYDIPFFCHYVSRGLKMHTHTDFYEFCLITSGSYIHTYGKTQTVCERGTLIFCKKGEAHSLVANAPNSYHYALIIKDDFFQEFCNRDNSSATKILAESFVEKKLQGFQLVYVSQLASSVSYSVSQDLFPVMEHFISTLIFTCIESLPNTLAKSSRMYAVDIFQRMNNFQALDEDVTQIYKGYPLSKSELTKDFKELTGYTLVQYRNIKRMEYAAQLLTETDYSVTDIVGILNLSSPGYLSKQFRKQYGMTPKQYQAKYLMKKSSSKSKKTSEASC